MIRLSESGLRASDAIAPLLPSAYTRMRVDRRIGSKMYGVQA